MQNSLFPACVWAHSSWHSLGSRTPLRSLLFCHHQTESWSQKRTQRQGWSCTFWQVSPGFQSWGLWPCRGAEHRRPTGRKKQTGWGDNGGKTTAGRSTIWTEEAYHLLPLKQAIRHELAGPDCHCVILKTWHGRINVLNTRNHLHHGGGCTRTTTGQTWPPKPTLILYLFL